MKLFWEPSLKKRLKNYSLVIGISIVLVVLIGLLVGSMGFVGDLIAKPHLNRMREEAIQSMEGFRRQGGYQKPVFFGEQAEGNAWEYYNRAIREIERASDEEWQNLELCSSKKNVDTTELFNLVSKYEPLLDDIRKGFEQKKCLIPLEYEMAQEMKIPNYMPLRRIAKFLVAHGYFEQREGRSHQAVRDYLNAIHLGQDIVGGDQTLIGHMIGVVCLGIGSDPIAEGLETFSFEKEDLSDIARVLHLLSMTWPSIGEAFMNESWRTTLLSERIEEQIHHAIPEGNIIWQLKQNPLLEWEISHLLSWSNLFSTRRALVEAITLQHEFAREITVVENQNLEEVNRVMEKWEKQARESHNLLAKIALPNFTSLVKRRMEGISKMRLRGVAALAQLYFLQNNRYPENLNEVGVQSALGGEPLLMDPMTGSSWQYRVYAEGDSCEIYSHYREKLDRPEDISHIACITLGPPRK